MSDALIRIAVAGSGGRMGRKIIQTIMYSKQAILGGALARTGSKFCGLDAGELLGIGAIGVTIVEDIAKIKDKFDILIDFTCPDASIDNIIFCRNNKKGIVIGTTGFTDTQKNVIRDAAQETCIVFASNFSIGVNLMLKLLEKIAHVMGNEADIEIIESHHRYKIDAPSATAINMGKTIANAIGIDLDNCAVYSRNGNIGERKEKSIGFVTVRAGDIIGEHTAMFANIGERLEITHKASNRIIFASGAIRAAIWLSKKKTGLFDMIDVLDLNKL